MKNKIKICLYNATGLRTKFDNLIGYIEKNNIDICMVTETWLKQESPLRKKIAGASFCEEGTNRGMAGTGIIFNSKSFHVNFDVLQIDTSNGRYSILVSDKIILVVVYLSPSLDLETVQEVMTDIFVKLENYRDKVIVFGGDFNSKHTSIGAISNCRRGEYIFNLFARHGFKIRNKVGMNQFTNVVDGCQPTIIDLIWTKGFGQSGDTMVENNVCLGSSSHRPVIATLKLPKELFSTNFQFEKVLNRKKLNDLDIIKLINEDLIESMDVLYCKITDKIEVLKQSGNNKHQMIAENKNFNKEIEKCFNESLNSSLQKFCGFKRVIKNRINIKETPKTIILQNQLNGIQRMLNKNYNEVLKLKKEEVIRQLEQEREEVRKRSFELFASSLALEKKQQQQKFLKRTARSRLSNTEKGIRNDTESLNKAADYFKSLFRNEKRKSVTFVHDWKLNDDEIENLIVEIVNEDIIKEMIKYSPKNKAPGNSLITNEILKVTSSTTTKVIVEWFKFCILSGTVPQGWCEAIIVPVFKKGDTSEISNYRPISLLENIRKLFERCLLGFIKSTMAKLEIHQGGFQEKRSTLDQIVCLDEMIRIFKNRCGKYPYITYLDIKAAYDSVDRQILYEECIKKEINPVVVEMLKQLFEFNKAKVSINGKSTSTFRMLSGVQQGSILSPLLYSIFIDKMTVELSKGPGIRIDDSLTINCLLYADDIVVVANSASEMNLLLKYANKVAKNNNFEFNIKKCAYTGERDVILRIGNEKIGRTNTFTYLGVQFNYKVL